MTRSPNFVLDSPTNLFEFRFLVALENLSLMTVLVTYLSL